MTDVVDGVTFVTGDDHSDCSLCEAANSPFRWMVHQTIAGRAPVEYLCDSCLQIFMEGFERSKETYRTLREAGMDERTAIDKMQRLFKDKQN